MNVHLDKEASGDLREVGRHARALGWTRDPFDRLIVAHVLATEAMLLTADATIREHCPQGTLGQMRGPSRTSNLQRSLRSPYCLPC